MSDDLDFLRPYFLGPNAENANLLESLLVEFVRDHAYWRRNFHPEDGPSIPPSAQYQDEYLAFVGRMKRELLRLSGQLKRAVPFFHPRYIGHMASDLVLPGVIARLMTTLYNPNNVVEEAASVTLEMELEVGEQLARMFGYAVGEECDICAWGHLTSGGTVANYESLWNSRSVKFYGLALAAAAAELGFDPDPVGPLEKPLSSYTKWELLNLSIQETVELREAVATRYAETHDRRGFYEFAQTVKAHRIETLGTAGFFRRHADVEPPVVLVSDSAHYSWEKGMKALGFGTANLLQVDVDSHMRMDGDRLAARLEGLFAERRPVLSVVGVLGTTEFGTIDPIHEITGLRRAWREKGCHFDVHVDAAWGGYLMAMFRHPDGSLRSREAMRRYFRHFPSEKVYRAFAAVSEADTITVDPHKMGYVPYSAGAFVARDRRVVDFITQRAAYVFDLGGAEADVPMTEKLRNLGQYILEGSKAGAAAASVHVTHQVLPLHYEGFGRILEQTVIASEHFFHKTHEVAARLQDVATITVPFEPDSNLVCVLVNPVGNASLAALNRFGRTLFEAMRVDPSQPVQVKRFIVSYTSLLKETLPGDQAHRILEEAGIDPATFRLVPEADDREADHIFVLRHTLMNPWLMMTKDGRNYIDLYWEYLEGLIRETLADA